LKTHLLFTEVNFYLTTSVKRRAIMKGTVLKC